MKQFSSKLNTGFIVILVILVLALLGMVGFYNYKMNSLSNDYKSSINDNQIPYADTYIFKSHGFQIELPKSFIPSEETNARGNLTTIMFSSENMIQHTNDPSNWEANVMKNFVQQGQEKIGENTFNVFLNPSMNATLYWFKKGNEGYMFSGDKNLLKTFEFIGSNDQVYIYKNHGFEIELPKGFIPNETESEGGPYLFIQLPDGGSIIQVGNVSFVKDLGGYCKAIQGGGDSTISKTPVIFGSSPFYLHTCEMEEFYVFEQGNVAYVFRMGNYDAHATEIIRTFKFIGWK